MELAGVIFDTDGVITKTASVHLAAWKRVFGEFLAARRGGSAAEFTDADYRRYVDGIDRYSGVAAFLASRSIVLPWGDTDDAPGLETVCGLGNLKNRVFTDHLRTSGVEVFPSTVRLIGLLRDRGIGVAAISASRNCAAVLTAAGVADLFDARVDGIDAVRLGLAGKPAPDMFVEAARRMGVPPAACAVVEDAAAGVAAARAGGFRPVIGVDRTRHPEELADAADLVVPDLADITVGDAGLVLAPRPSSHLPELASALTDADVPRLLDGRPIAVFLDYDGTLTPIVARPEDAVLAPTVRRVLAELAVRVPVGIISGRDLDDVRAMVGVDGLWYAGSHGFDVVSPDGRRQQFEQGRAALPALDGAEGELGRLVDEVAGAWVERKRFAIAVHHRATDPADVPRLEALVAGVARSTSGLRLTGGKQIFELRPDVDWDKGRALQWVLGEATGADRSVLPLYIGDDETDEDAFRSIRASGVGVVVGGENRETAAHYRLGDPDDVRRFLSRVSGARGGA